MIEYVQKWAILSEKFEIQEQITSEICAQEMQHFHSSVTNMNVNIK